MPLGDTLHRAYISPQPAAAARLRASNDWGGYKVIARILTTLAGIALIVYGAIAAISPLPLGVPLIILGFLMIALANPAARPLVRRMRRKWRWFDKLVEALGKRSPEDIKEVIEETDPDHEEETDNEEENDEEKESDAPCPDEKAKP